MAAKQRYIFVGFLGLVALVGMALSHGTQRVLAAWGVPDAAPLAFSDLTLSSFVGFTIAAFGALVLSRVGTTRRWIVDVADELVRVDWPSREETGHATVVVIVCVVVSALFLGFFDASWLWLTGTLLGVSGPSAG